MLRTLVYEIPRYTLLFEAIIGLEEGLGGPFMR